MLIEISENELIDILNIGATKTLVVAAPNYEERSTVFPEFILQDNLEHPIDHKKIILRLITLESTEYAVGILNDLKYSHIITIERNQKLKELGDYHREILLYPESFNYRALNNLFRGWIKQLEKETVNILVDISGLPRLLIIELAEVIDDIRKERKRQIKNILIAYILPESYSFSQYPHDIGELRGYFSGRPLKAIIRRNQHIIAIIFPGLQGFESKLLYDEIAASKGPKHVFVPLLGCDLIRSMATMRVNLPLLSHKGINMHYYFSIDNGISLMEEILSNDVYMSDVPSNSLVLIAPFGPKPFSWAAPLICEDLQNVSDIETEITLLSGHQYSSVYSIGKRDMLLFRLHEEEEV
jgi:hypothetical protein